MEPVNSNRQEHDQINVLIARDLVQAAAEQLSRLGRTIQYLDDLLGSQHRVLAAVEEYAGNSGAPPGLPREPNPRADLVSVSPDARLTHRERQVLDLLVQGLSNRRIARTLRISEPTVKNHLHAVFVKLNVTDRTQAISKVLRTRDR